MPAQDLSPSPQAIAAEFNFWSRMRERQRLVRRALEEQFPADSSPLLAAIREALLAEGKRLRPLLCLEACEWVGGSLEAALPAACALEMIHKMTLVHDDLPAMDDVETRGDRPSLHRSHGEALAILAGDALLVHAFGLLASTPGVPAERITRAIVRLASALGTAGVAGGQALDVSSHPEPLSPEQLEQVHARKTGSLFEAALGVGAELGGAEASQQWALSRYGMLLGRAFQISDDILDARAGRPARCEEATNYVQVLGLEEAEHKLHELVEQAITAFGAVNGGDPRPLAGIAAFVLQRSMATEREDGN